MARMTRKELTKSVNKGWAFEAQMSLLKRYKRDGRAGSYDLMNKGRVYECKFFTIKPATKGKNAEYNSAHGFKAIKSKSLYTQVQEYCSTFDTLIVGYGESIDNYDSFTMTSEEAVEWLYKRLQHKAGSDEVRFCWGGKSLESRYESRLAKLKSEGYTL